MDKTDILSKLDSFNTAKAPSSERVFSSETKANIENPLNEVKGIIKEVKSSKEQEPLVDLKSLKEEVKTLSKVNATQAVDLDGLKTQVQKLSQAQPTSSAATQDNSFGIDLKGLKQEVNTFMNNHGQGGAPSFDATNELNQLRARVNQFETGVVSTIGSGDTSSTPSELLEKLATLEGSSQGFNYQQLHQGLQALNPSASNSSHDIKEEAMGIPSSEPTSNEAQAKPSENQPASQSEQPSSAPITGKESLTMDEVSVDDDYGDSFNKVDDGRIPDISLNIGVHDGTIKTEQKGLFGLVEESQAEPEEKFVKAKAFGRKDRDRESNVDVKLNYAELELSKKQIKEFEKSMTSSEKKNLSLEEQEARLRLFLLREQALDEKDKKKRLEERRLTRVKEYDEFIIRQNESHIIGFKRKG